MTERKEHGDSGLMTYLSKLLGLKEPQLRSLALILALGLVGLWFVNWDLGAAADRRRSGPPAGTQVQATPPAAGPDLAVAAPAESGPVAGLAAVESRLARELEGILSLVQGAGRVRVWVRLAAGPTQVPAMEQRSTSRTIQEQDPGGGTRQTTDSDTDSRPAMASAPDGGSAPFVLRQEGARVEGVVVVAEGAHYPAVRAQLTEAAALALGVPPNRVAVLAMAPAAPTAGGDGQ